MNAVLEAREPSARYLEVVQPALVRKFELLATAKGAVTQLRELILALAVQGKLVHQDARDEPASALLDRIARERARLIAAGRLRQSKDSTAEDVSEPPYSLPQGWAWSRLAAIGVINPRNDGADDVVASFVQMSSIPVAFNDPHAAEARPWQNIKSGFTQFAEGDVGVAKITPCFENGKSTVFQNLSNGIGAGTTELHIVRPLCGVVPRYVLMFLKSPRFLREGETTMTGTAGQKRLPRSFFENSPFPLPPLAEQARIVVRVDELMRLCDALEARGRLEAEQHARLLGTLLGTLTDSSTPEELAANWQRVAGRFDLLLDRPGAVDALEKTILQLAVRGLLVPQDSAEEPANLLLLEVHSDRRRRLGNNIAKADKPSPPINEAEVRFALPPGWSWVRLSEISNVIVDCPHSTAKFVDTGLLCLDTNSFKDGKLLPHKLRFVSQETFDERIARLKPESGDLVFAREGSVGQSIIIPEGIECCLGQRVMLFRLSQRVSNEFVRLAITTEDFLDSLLSLHKGIGAKHVNVADMRNAVVPLPPFREQARILARVTELRRLCADLRQRLTACQTTQSQLAEALVESAAA